jgi:hypothetical protein
VLKSEAVTAMPRSGYNRGLRNGYEPELAGRQWLSDTETDDVFLVSSADWKHSVQKCHCF